MKFLVVILVVAVVGWLLLRGRARPAPKTGRSRPREQAQSMMVQCRHCGVHLPRGDAVEGSNGVFCSEAHRLAGPR